jgi:hypothetical protein
MSRLVRSIFAAASLFLVSALLHAQMQMPAPPPELKKLDYLVGSWTTEGDLKPGPMGPGGKITETIQNEWMDGHFFMLEHLTFKTGMGNGSGLAIMSYKPEEKVYTYNNFNSMGEAEYFTGTIDGDTWTWTGDHKMGPSVIKSRFIMKVVSPSSYTFKYEVSQDGISWTTVLDGKATKAK